MLDYYPHDRCWCTSSLSSAPAVFHVRLCMHHCSPDAVSMNVLLRFRPSRSKSQNRHKKRLSFGTAWQSVGLSQLNRKPANMFGLTRLTFALKLNSNPCLVPLALPYSLFASDVFPWVVWCLFLWGMFYWSVQRGLSAGWIYSVKLWSVYNPWGTSFEAFGINCSVLWSLIL